MEKDKIKAYRQRIASGGATLLIKLFHVLPTSNQKVEGRNASLFPHRKQSTSQPTLWPFFLISLFFLFCFRGLRLFFFSPFLALIQMHLPLLFCLWISALTGLILDFFSTSLPFGIHALSLTLSSLILYQLLPYLVHKPIVLVSCTALFSLFTTCGLHITLLLLDKELPWKGATILTDFFIMPLFDGLYAFICFSLPMQLLAFIKKQWFHFLFLQKEHKKEG